MSSPHAYPVGTDRAWFGYGKVTALAPMVSFPRHTRSRRGYRGASCRRGSLAVSTCRGSRLLALRTSIPLRGSWYCSAVRAPRERPHSWVDTLAKSVDRLAVCGRERRGQRSDQRSDQHDRSNRHCQREVNLSAKRQAHYDEGGGSSEYDSR